jgi:hypothetical protein
VALPVLPLGLSLGSAAAFGLSTSLQHLTSSQLKGARTHSLLASLVRTPLWLAGMGLSVVAFVMHAIALSAGALVVVQPVIVTGVVFAVLIRAALDRRRPSRAEVGWATLTWAGLATFLLGVGSPTVATGLPEHAASAVASLLGLSGLAALCARRCREGSVSKGLWLGVVSGVLFGLVAVLLKLILITATAGPADGPVGALVSWPLWAMVASGSCAVLVNQRAYQTTRLSVSMPILNIVDVLVALVLAAVVFGETPTWALGTLVAEGAGLAVMGLGVTRLAHLEDERDQPSSEALDTVVDPSLVPLPDLQEVS